MKGFYQTFARLAIRLLVAIYWHQVALPGLNTPDDVPVIKEANAWLEATK